MTFLKKLGIVIAKGVGIIAGVVPFVSPVAQGVLRKSEDILDQIGQMVITAEAMGAALTLTGAQKLAAIVPLAIQAFKQSEMLAGKKIADEAAFKAGVTQVVNGVVAIYNSLHEDNVRVDGQ